MRKPHFQIVCSACGQSHRLVGVRPGSQRARCARCGEPMFVGKGTPVSVLPLSLAAALCWLIALWLPIARVEQFGSFADGYLLRIGAAFRSHGHIVLGLASDLALVVFPSVLFALIPWVAFGRARGRAAMLCDFAKRWAMTEVFALSVLVAFIKLDTLGDASIASGFWFLAAAVVLMTWILQRVDLVRYQLPKSRAAAVSFMVAAAVLLIPANALPIMSVATTSSFHRSTILEGTASLFSAGMWGVAAIVFAASVLVPFCKLGGLAWLFALSRRGEGSRYSMSIYRVLDFIGRWSMLDVFLIGILAALVDFGEVASVTPGPAAPAFAGAVVFTILAMENFDTKTLWRRRREIIA